MAARLNFEVRFPTQGTSPRKRVAEEPMRILVLGDFSGRSRAAPSEPSPLKGRRVIPVDVDCFGDVMASLAPKVTVPDETSGAALELGFREIDDFHPDTLVRRLPVFAKLRSIRERLTNPSSFPAAAEELRSFVHGLPPASTTVTPEPSTRTPEGDAETLDRLLGRKPSDAATPTPRDPVEDVVQRIAFEAARESTVPRPGADLSVYLAVSDETAGARMRTVLHAPDFQALEATWRSLHSLVSGIKTGEELSLHVLDVTKAELRAEIAAAEGDLGSSNLLKLLVDGGSELPGDRPWSLIAADFSFGAAPEDLGLLEALGAVSSWAGGPFLAAAEPGVLGCPAIEESLDSARWSPPSSEWERLRRSPSAPWLGLALPRVLLRLPYGPKREEIDSFPFDEVGPIPDRGALLWGNPTFLCARLIASVFSERGWSMAPGDVLEVGDLPALAYEENGEKKRVPCAEAWIGERAGQGMLERGLIPILSRQDRNAVRVLRFQSLANPPQPLAGPWRD